MSRPVATWWHRGVPRSPSGRGRCSARSLHHRLSSPVGLRDGIRPAQARWPKRLIDATQSSREIHPPDRRGADRAGASSLRVLPPARRAGPMIPTTTSSQLRDQPSNARSPRSLRRRRRWAGSRPRALELPMKSTASLGRPEVLLRRRIRGVDQEVAASPRGSHSRPDRVSSPEWARPERDPLRAG
jgi:hypothetical protein